MDPLHCIVGGYAQGGTTLLSQFLRQHPRIDGRFEIGFLLARNPRDFFSADSAAPSIMDRLRPRLHEQITRHWGITPAELKAVCDCDTFQESYRRLLDASELPDKRVRIYDKLPRYMAHLSDVMERSSVPAVMVVRDPRAIFWSKSKYEHRGKPTIEQHAKNYNHEGAKCREAKKRFGSRVLIVQHESLCLNPDREGGRIFGHLGLDWDPSYTALEDRLRHVGKAKLREGLAVEVVREYRDNVTESDQRRLLELTEDFAEWHWHE